MERILISALLILYSLNSFSQGCQELRVASGANSWAPISTKNQENNQFEGIAFDMVEAVATKLDLPVTILDLPWKRHLMYLEAGQVDVALAIYKNKEREKKYLYTNSYFSNEAKVFVKKGLEFPFNQLGDLTGRMGAIPAGGSFGDDFDSFVKANIRYFQIWHTDVQKDVQIRMILHQRNDYFVSDHFDGMSYLIKAGLQDKITPLPHPIAKNDIYFALSKKSPCASLIPKINDIIKTLTQEGTVSRIAEKYMNLPLR